MALYKQKFVPPVDALELPNGDYAYVKDGTLVSVPKAEFEAKYEKQV